MFCFLPVDSPPLPYRWLITTTRGNPPVVALNAPFYSRIYPTVLGLQEGRGAHFGYCRWPLMADWGALSKLVGHDICLEPW